MQRKRVWGFTLNNWTKDEVAHWHKHFLKYKITKFRFQVEIGEKNKTPHLQGAVTFKNPVRFKTLKELLPRANWYLADNPKKLYEYCHKKDTATGEAWEWELKRPTLIRYTKDELNSHLHAQWLDNLVELDAPEPITRSQTIMNLNGVGELYEIPSLE